MQADIDTIKTVLDRICDRLERQQVVLGASVGIRQAAAEQGVDWPRHCEEQLAEFHEIRQLVEALGGGYFGAVARRVLTAPELAEVAEHLRALMGEEGALDPAAGEELSLARFIHDRFSAKHPRTCTELLRHPGRSREALRGLMNPPPAPEAPYWWQGQAGAPERP